MRAASALAGEIAQIPDTVARQMEQALPLYVEAGEKLRRRRPAVVATCARGSSDCAALYFQYLAGARLGAAVASLPPSLASVYRAPLAMKGGVMLAVSQSGAGTDLCELQHAARNGGALTVALTNHPQNRLGQAADICLPLCAGEERAVAATKTFVTSMAALAAIAAAWRGDDKMIDAIRALPDCLDAALRQQWRAPVAQSWYVVSRGVMTAAAAEGALKLKEICRVHAEALSAAELRHGPITLAAAGVAVFAFATRDAAAASVRAVVADVRCARTPVVYVGGTEEDAADFSFTPSPSPWLDPISAITSFYVFAERTARESGINLDSPPLLKKVTDTV